MGIRGSGELYPASRPIRKLSKGKFPVIQQVGVAPPMLFVVVSLGQQPKLVAAVVKPLAFRWWHVLPFKLWIDEKIGMPVEPHLHQTSAILRNDDELHPSVRNLLRLPSFIVN